MLERKKKKVGPSQPLTLLRNLLLVEHKVMWIISNGKYFCLSHECKARLASAMSVKHPGSHSQPLSSRDTVRIRDGTAVVLNPSWKVVKLDLWFISSVTLHGLQLNRVMSSAGKRGKVQYWEEPEEGISNPKTYSITVAEMLTVLLMKDLDWYKAFMIVFCVFASVGVAQMSLEVRCWGEAEEQREGE